MLKQVHCFIKGDVIGVGFRAWTKIQAKSLKINGWVRNNFERPEIFGDQGGVEAVFQGEEDNINNILQLVKVGPPVAHVDEVEYFNEEIKEIFDSFEIRK